MTPRLPAVTPRQAVRALERCGWQLDRVRGSHHVFRHQLAVIDIGWCNSTRLHASLGDIPPLELRAGAREEAVRLAEVTV